MQQNRQFIRHPTDIPIEVREDAAPVPREARVHNVSHGGLALDMGYCFDPGAIVEVRIPAVDPPFEVRGRVVWCREREGGFEMGVQFLDASDAFRARMVEQVCHIEQFRRRASEREGREVSRDEAADAWIRENAADFP